jgi:hypothetical protein
MTRGALLNTKESEMKLSLHMTVLLTSMIAILTGAAAKMLATDVPQTQRTSSPPLSLKYGDADYGKTATPKDNLRHTRTQQGPDTASVGRGRVQRPKRQFTPPSRQPIRQQALLDDLPEATFVPTIMEPRGLLLRMVAAGGLPPAPRRDEPIEVFRH